MIRYLVGDSVSVVISAESPKEDQWQGTDSTGLALLLQSRSARLFAIGEQVEAWVIRDSEPLVVSDSDFGRLPITERMRLRYEQAVATGLRLLDGESDHIEDADSLSDLTGMFSRSWRKDQWDWYTVWEALVRPDPSEARVTGERFRTLARAVRAGESSSMTGLLSELRAGPVREWLESAAVRLRSPVTPSTTLTLRQFPSSAPDKRARQSPGASGGEDPTVIMSAAQRQKLERANAEHARTLAVLADALRAAGVPIQSNQLIDLFAQLPSGPAIFEVKSITAANEREQARHALSQLYEYRYLHNLPKATLWAVFSASPRLSWIVEYLRSDRSVRVLWIANGELTGPDRGALAASN